MRIILNIDEDFSNAIIKRAKDKAKELGRVLSDEPDRLRRIVTKVVDGIFNNENATYYQSHERIDEWIAADKGGDCLFQQVIRQNSTTYGLKPFNHKP